jgi:hypothetical protein
MAVSSASESTDLLLRWRDQIMPNHSTLEDATTHLLNLRQPFLLDQRRVPEERDQRLVTQAWRSLNHKFKRFWGVAFDDLVLDELPVAARAALTLPQQLLLEERFSQEQRRQLACLEGVRTIRMAPPGWQPWEANRVALWQQLSEGRRYHELTEMLLEQTSRDLQKAMEVCAGAMDRLLAIDVDHMRTGRAAYMGMFPICSTKTKRSRTPDAPKKMMRTATKHPATFKGMIERARQERLFDEECMRLPALDTPPTTPREMSRSNSTTVDRESSATQ